MLVCMREVKAGETARMYMLGLAFAAHRCDKYQYFEFVRCLEYMPLVPIGCNSNMHIINIHAKLRPL